MLLAPWILFGAGRDQHGVVRAGDLGHPGRHRGVERVADLFDDQPHRGRGAAGAQCLGDAVAPEAQLGDRREYPVDQVLLHVRGVVDHPGDGLDADPGALGDVDHRRAARRRPVGGAPSTPAGREAVVGPAQRLGAVGRRVVAGSAARRRSARSCSGPGGRARGVFTAARGTVGRTVVGRCGAGRPFPTAALRRASCHANPRSGRACQGVIVTCASLRDEPYSLAGTGLCLDNVVLRIRSRRRRLRQCLLLRNKRT